MSVETIVRRKTKVAADQSAEEVQRRSKRLRKPRKMLLIDGNTGDASYSQQVYDPSAYNQQFESELGEEEYKDMRLQEEFEAEEEKQRLDEEDAESDLESSSSSESESEEDESEEKVEGEPESEDDDDDEEELRRDLEAQGEVARVVKESTTFQKPDERDKIIRAVDQDARDDDDEDAEDASSDEEESEED